MTTPSWSQITTRARAPGWRYGSPRRSNISEWYKPSAAGAGSVHTGPSTDHQSLWWTEVEGPLWS